VQVILDLSSFPRMNHVFLEGLFKLPKQIFEFLKEKDIFGLKVVKQKKKKTHIEDVLQLEEKSMNILVKT